MNYLKVSYQIGGFYDLVLGLSVLFLRDYALKYLGFIIPNVPILVDALALFLIAYGYLLLAESNKIEPILQVGYTSSFVRISFCLLVFYYIFWSKIELIYVLFGLTDFLTGIFIFVSSMNYNKMHSKLISSK